MPETMDKRETNQRARWAQTFLGDTPGRVLVRLILTSLVVGFLMSVFGVSPQAIMGSIERFAASLFDNGYDVLRGGLGYVLTGAAIVVPLWLLSRLFAAGRRR